MSIKPDDFVYCTRCRNFGICETQTDLFPCCIYENECNLFDCENSRRFAERQRYEPWTCGECSHFIGGGDWNLCCTEHHEGYPFGFLCYEYTPACDRFNKKDIKE